MLQSRVDREDSNRLDAEEHEGDGTHGPAKSNVIDKLIEHYPASSAQQSWTMAFAGKASRLDL